MKSAEKSKDSRGIISRLREDLQTAIRSVSKFFLEFKHDQDLERCPAPTQKEKDKNRTFLN